MGRLLPRLLASALLLGVTSGCAGKTPPKTETPEAGETPPAPDPDEHAFYTGAGDPTSLDAYLTELAQVDLIAFGELHYHPIARRYQAALLEGLAAQPRPLALALEFFEADHQAAIDEYLAGAIDEATFRERTGRGERYDDAHRPLVEYCKAHKIPVIAANAPRRLVTAYRKSGLSYPEYLASLSPEDRAYMPLSSEPRDDDEFKERFMALMGPERGPAFYKSMALWNDAMAESVARFRTKHPEHRVLLVVGVFHVAARLGLIREFRIRRPDDAVSVLTMQQTDGAVEFTEDDEREGDVVLKVREPAREPAEP
ncbi:MAG: ChaN family lipoprotein [Myxococcales bacterium]|nr:ChaN family lipoprotein [Myxococcales bacterium]